MIKPEKDAVEQRMEDDQREPAFDLRDRTLDFALRIIRLFATLPKEEDGARILGDQLLRSGTSLGANYREAHRGRSKPEFITKIADCLKDLDETQYWLDLLSHSNILPASRLAGILDETHQLLAIFTTISKKSKGS